MNNSKNDLNPINKENEKLLEVFEESINKKKTNWSNMASYM